MINIIKYRKIPFTISAILFVVSLILILTIGLKPSIDFTGGSLLEVSFTGERPTVTEVQTSLAEIDFDLGEVIVQPSEESNILLRMRFVSEEEHQLVLAQIRKSFEVSNDESNLLVEGEGDVIVEVETGDNIENFNQNRVLEERIETIGPAISSHLRSRAIYAVIAVVIAIVLYVAYAFRKVSKPVQSWKYGLSAVVALVHDVTFTMGIFVLLGKYLNVEVGIPFVVALLTILGYSVNDSIVVFDRVRENLIKRSAERFSEMVNMGVNQTLVRSFNTSLTTLIVLFALFLFGGESIKYFALALIVGILSGTYSSIFLASPLLVVWERLKKRKV